ncbi:OLC1v1028643C1 [Oldenlandia corymbosa var. corymbosa]|uniref:OLC1v1028643C1 n=1 Tax=Oldenlandia corymbosa var. corymbosa TaxID=529605 RepID=A0AAV1CDV2_OLDCO|nr:OLC1v1028643C1 [Oldenlandia corymbosa var. corymbosa]
MEKKSGEEELKHLGFVKVAAINAVVCISHLYDYAKQNSGSFKSTLETVENAVTTVVRPVYGRFKGVPDDALVFLDMKVDELSNQFDKCAPPVAKSLASKVQQLVKQASEVAAYLAREVIVSGPCATFSSAASLSKNFFVSKLAFLWYEINRFPPVHLVGNMALPTVAYFSERYNNFTSKMDARGYHVFGYFPLVPIDDFIKAYKQVEAAAVVKKDD